MVALVETRHLNFEYALSDHKSLSDVTLSVEAGAFIVIAGPSGSGKTTLLRQLKPELQPVGKLTGEILFNSHPINELSTVVSAQSIGMVFQSPDDQLVMDNVIQELAFSLENVGMSSGDIQRRIAELASFLGLQDLLYEDVANLSGGQKQLVNLASVLILRPKLLLLDEPTAQLDPIAAKSFMSLLQRIHDELGITIVMTEHVLDDVLPLADELWFIRAGKITDSNTVSDTLGHLWQQPDARLFVPDVPYVFLNNQLTQTSGLPLTVVAGRRELREGKAKFKRLVVATAAEPVRRNWAVNLTHVAFEYDRNGNYVLDDLNLKVPENDWLAIIGKNGTGKTTLLKVMMGLLTPRRGTAKLLGKRVNSWHQQSLYQQVSFLSQTPSDYFSYDTVMAEFVARAEQLGLTDPQQAAQEMLTRLDLMSLANQNPHDASGGEQQLIALGILLLSAPSVLLLDEPTKGLDPVRRQRLGELLKRLQQERGVTIVMVSHDMAFSARFADHCALLFDGQIVSQAEPHQFFAENFFYTTATNRLMRDLVPNLITREEVVVVE